jgi:hypothetical protein
MDKNQMDTLLKAAEQKLKQEPTAEISNDGQNNISYRLGMVAWGDSKSLSAYSICFLVVNSKGSNPTPRTTSVGSKITILSITGVSTFYAE